MRYNFLGNSGLEVSEICLGVMTFGGGRSWQNLGGLSQRQANELTKIALDAGVNFFDTADIYSDGLSEIMLGKALGRRRQEAVIATKCGFRMSPGPNGDGLSRRRIIEACDASLKRLGTDYIDLYQIHSFDFVTPLEETLSTFDWLIKQGKIRYSGCSNFTGWQLMKALALCDQNGWERFVSLQAYYSLVGRDIELELVPACLDQRVGIMVWGPLHGGFLTGKYRWESWAQKTRLSSPDDVLPMDLEKGYLIVDQMERIAKNHEASIAQLALNYLLNKPGITSLVIGARTKEQLIDNLKTVNWRLEPEEMNQLDQISAPLEIYPHWYFNIFRKERMKR